MILVRLYRSPSPTDLLHEIELCSRLYSANKCHPETRLLVLEMACQSWERCTNKDPKVISRAMVWAEVLGDAVNAFVESLAWRTLVRTIKQWRSIS